MYVRHKLFTLLFHLTAIVHHVCTKQYVAGCVARARARTTAAHQGRAGKATMRTRTGTGVRWVPSPVTVWAKRAAVT